MRSLESINESHENEFTHIIISGHIIVISFAQPFVAAAAAAVVIAVILRVIRGARFKKKTNGLKKKSQKQH